MPPCQFCEQDIASEEALDEHKKMRINLRCNRCGRPFVNYCALGGHLARAHIALPIRDPGNSKANSTVDADGTERSEQEIEKSNNETRPASGEPGSKDPSKTASAPSNNKVNTAIEEADEIEKRPMVATLPQLENKESNDDARSTRAVTGSKDPLKPPRTPDNSKVSIAIEADEVEKYTRLAITPRQDIKESNNGTRSTSAVSDSKDRFKTASALEKEISILSNELSVQEEVQRPEKSNEVRVSDVALRSLNIGVSKPMACLTCNKTEVSLMALHVHQVMQEHCYCKECKAFFPNDASGKIHTDTFHRYTCQECGKIFATVGRLQGHQVQHDHCYCKSCSCFFLSNGDMVRHSATVHVHPCGLCKEVFRYPKDLVDHQNFLRHHAHCNHCTAKFGWAHELIKHLEQDHTPCKCAYCQHGFQTAEELHTHQKVAINFYCMVCNISFQSDKATELHNNASHQTMTCMVCGRHFLNDQALLVHTAYKLNCPG